MANPTNVSRRICAAAFAALGFAMASVFPSLPARAEGLEPLDITTASGSHHLEVEVMRTEAEKTKGLMFRRFLPADRGMLFEFDRDERVSMWMKNTYLPLDMIFVGRDGKVVSIARDTEPLSEKIISSGVPAASVIEVNAGTAAKLGVAPGDVVTHAVPKP